MSRGCAGSTKRGEPCRMAPLNNSHFCYGHDPLREADRLASRSLGGLRRRRVDVTASVDMRISLSTVSAILSYLEQAAVDLRRSEPGIARARTQIYLAATAMKVVEVSEIDRRITALEALLSTPPQEFK